MKQLVYTGLLLLTCHTLQIQCQEAKSTYFYLTRSWSPSFCKFDYSADRKGACQNATNRFTIHGLWLTCSNGGWPDESSCSSEPYDPSQAADLAPVLDQQWPSYGDKGNDAFWNHEWTCHGVCAGIVDKQISSQAAFFQRVLQLDMLNTLNVLAEQLQLDSEIDTSDFVSKATGLLGAKPIVTCYKRYGRAYLDSVMTCLRNDLSLEDCQDSDESCDVDKLTVPSWYSRPSHAQRPEHMDSTAVSEAVQRRLLRSDPHGCAVSGTKCILP